MSLLALVIPDVSQALGLQLRERMARGLSPDAMVTDLIGLDFPGWGADHWASTARHVIEAQVAWTAVPDWLVDWWARRNLELP